MYTIKINKYNKEQTGFNRATSPEWPKQSDSALC